MKRVCYEQIYSLQERLVELPKDEEKYNTGRTASPGMREEQEKWEMCWEAEAGVSEFKASSGYLVSLRPA